MKSKVLAILVFLLFISLITPVFAGGQRGYRVVVDQNKTITELIKEAKFDETTLPNDDIDGCFQNDEFPVSTKEVTIKFILFGEIGSKEVLERIKKMGYRPATPKEILTFAIKYPNKQRFYPIAIANPNWKGCRCPHYMFILSGDLKTRILNMKMFGYSEYPDDYRWAVVPLK
ncbi:MAG: hypothetical protein UT05_C0005G0034 [Parcubacteria group bacterium GW2011_GWF2_38_76]|nr:MAG: hypothetical protein UT05_C0005G0034 [Parcubacteria group bacterium GW2011_GWF2_38_76]HBM45605.1 hypothetical protein [Patescibacteria group bacterium]